jgi:hypothetical protein
MVKGKLKVLLLRDRAWFQNSPEDALVPWTSIRSWRAALRRNNGELDSASLRAIIGLNDERSPRVQEEFSEATHGQSKTSVLRLWSLLPTALRKQAEPRGLPLRLIPPALLEPLLDEGLLTNEELLVGKLTISGKAIETPVQGSRSLTGLLLQGIVTRGARPELHTALLSSARSQTQMKSSLAVERTSSGEQK